MEVRVMARFPRILAQSGLSARGRRIRGENKKVTFCTWQGLTGLGTTRDPGAKRCDQNLSRGSGGGGVEWLWVTGHILLFVTQGVLIFVEI